MIRRSAQRFHGCPHGAMAGAQNVDAIDLQRINNAHRPLQLGVGRQFLINLLPQIRRELFGIVQPAMTEIFRQNYSRSDDRAGQGSAAGFVNPGNARDPGGAQFLFVAKSATAAHAAP